MIEKTQPLGICDLCLEPFLPGVSLYTRRGPRRYCSRTCRNAGNSRAGAAIRARKAKERVAAGTWQNPAEIHAPDPANIAAGVSRTRKREVEAGTWRNPATTPEARAKLSTPRKYADNPLLHSAMQKLSQGLRMHELLPAEADAFRAHRQTIRDGDRERFRRYSREGYRRRMATEAGRAKQREQDRRQRERNRARGPNEALRQARIEAGYSQAALAQLVGVSAGAVSRWENESAVPRQAMRARVVEVLGVTVGSIFTLS